MIELVRMLCQYLSNSYTSFIELTSSLFAAANAEKTRCYRIQEYIYNYCIKVTNNFDSLIYIHTQIPTYRLDIGCPALTGCGREFALISTNTTTDQAWYDTIVTTLLLINYFQTVDRLNTTDQLHNRQCHDVTVNKYKGAILSDCHRLIGQVGERQSHCIYVKRTLPHRECCKEDDSVTFDDQLESHPNLLPCNKFQEVESKFCFDVPVEQREQCNRQLISDKCSH